MSFESEGFLPANNETLKVQALGEWMLICASEQGSWPVSEHENFLALFSSTVSSHADNPLSLELSPDAPTDAKLPSSVALPCIKEIAPFEHALEVDCEPGLKPDQSLIARAKQLCRQCPIEEDCYAYGVRSPELLYGLYGGQSREERQATWREHHNERLSQLRSAYEPVGMAWKAYVGKVEEKEGIRDALLGLKKQLTQVHEEAPREHTPEVKAALLDPALVERADLLLYTVPRRILQHWVRSMQQPIEPFSYDKERINPRIYHIHGAEQFTTEILLELAAGEFNYKRWLIRTRTKLHNPITFLVAIGETIPDGDITNLKQLAQRKVALLRTGFRKPGEATRVTSVLSAYFGLGDAEPLNYEEIARIYGTPAKALPNLVRRNLKRIREILGNNTEDDPEKES